MKPVRIMVRILKRRPTNIMDIQSYFSNKNGDTILEILDELKSILWPCCRLTKHQMKNENSSATARRNETARLRYNPPVKAKQNFTADKGCRVNLEYQTVTLQNENMMT